MRKSIWNAIERKLDDYSLRKKFYIFYVLCVMLPLIVTDAVVLSIVNNAEKESSRHEMSSIASAVGYNLSSMVNNAGEAAKSIYTSKRIDDFISKEYTSSAEYVSEYQSFFQDTLFENTLGMSNIVFFLYADNPTIVNGGILLNEIASKGGKKVVQTISYLPHFLSWIIVTGILHDMLSGTGIVNEFLVNMHIIDQPINFFAHTGYFWPIVAFANVWKETGWNAIIYLAAITSIDPSLYEAASIDGAGRWAKIKYVTLPGIKPTIIILLLMNVGNVLNAGFEIQYLLGNGLIQKVSQTIDIYVLKWGISQGDYAIGTAAGIFKSVVSIILIFIANKIAKHNGEEQLF